MNDIVKLMVDTHKGIVPTQYANTTKMEREDAIRKALFEVIGATEYGTKEYRQAMRRNKVAIYEIIEEVINETVVNGDQVRDAFYDMFAETRNLALGDKNEFYVEGANTLALAKYSGGHFNIKRHRVDMGQAFQVEVSDYGIAVYEYFDRFLAGRCDLARLIALAQEAVNKGISEAIYSTFNDALANLPSQFVYNGSYNESGILGAIAHVEAQKGQVPVLVGTRAALAKLQGKETAWISDDMKNKKNNLGYMEMWNGYRCIELKQFHKQGTFDFIFDDTKILVLPADAKLVKLVFEGDTRVVEITEQGDNADNTLQTTIALKFGVAVAYSDLIGTITITG